MMPVASPVAGLSIALDVADGSWTIYCPGSGADGSAEHRLRPWLWGERRRLVQAASRDGAFDGTVFVAGVAAALYEPPPPPALAPLFVYLALDLLGLGRGPAPTPLGIAEAWLAAEFAWLPSRIGAEPALALDSLLANLHPARQGTAEPGWNSIRIADPDDD